MQPMMRIGMLSIAIAMIVLPAASAATGAGATVTQRELACNLGRDIDTDQFPVTSTDARVVVARDCSTAHVEYDASRNVQLVCAHVDVLGLLPPVVNGPITQLETLPDNPPPYG